MSRRCSSSSSVGASPVVPATTTPSEPWPARWCSRPTKASSSTAPSASKGVTIAVRMAPSPGTGASYRSGSPWGGVAVSVAVLRLAGLVRAGGCGLTRSRLARAGRRAGASRRGPPRRRGAGHGALPAGSCAHPSRSRAGTNGTVGDVGSRDVVARQALTVEVAAVRWRADGEDFAVLAGVTDEGDEVTRHRAARARPGGRDRPGRGHLARAPAPRAPARGGPGPAAGGDERRGARGASGRGQARRPARRGVARRAPRARARAGRARPRPAAGACARCPASARCACGPRSRRGRRRAPSARCGSSSTSTASRPRRPGGSRVRSAPARSSGCGRTRGRWPRSTASASPPPTRSRAAWARPPTTPGAWTPGCCTRSARPRPTATAISPAPSWPPARAACSASTPPGASTRWRRPGGSRSTPGPTRWPTRCSTAWRRAWPAAPARCATRRRSCGCARRSGPRRASSPPTASGRWSSSSWATGSSILTGGPGTGKTSSMQALVDVLRGAGRSVRLCAPTGKAARRLAETTGAPATTIHRLLEWAPDGGFARGPDDPIPGTDVLVVDEASMLSVRLADALLGAVGPRTHVLLVGDVDQLAPVGPGRVLEDLIASGARADGRADRGLPPGGAVAHRARRPRHRRGPGAADAGRRGRRARLLPRRARRAVRGLRRGRLARGRAPPRATSASTRAATSSCSRRCTAARSASTRSTRSCARRLNPDGAPVPGTRLPRRRPPAADAQRPRARAHERRARAPRPPRRRPRRAAARRRRRPDAADPRGRGRDAAARLRDLGPQGAGQPGAGRRRAGRARPPRHAHAQPRLHGRHAGRAGVRPRRRPGALRTALARPDAGRRHTRLAERLAGGDDASRVVPSP